MRKSVTVTLAALAVSTLLPSAAAEGAWLSRARARGDAVRVVKAEVRREVQGPASYIVDSPRECSRHGREQVSCQFTIDAYEGPEMVACPGVVHLRLSRAGVRVLVTWDLPKICAELPET